MKGGPIVLNLRDFRTGARGPMRLPEDVVRIDRMSRWGNPFVIGATVTRGPAGNQHWDTPLTRDDVLTMYSFYLAGKLAVAPDFLEPLRGKRLACWCRPAVGFGGRRMCHGQIIAGRLYDIDPAEVE